VAHTTQDIAGTWQGTIHADKEMRIVLKILKSTGGEWHGVLYSLGSSQPSVGVATTSMSLRGADFAFAIAPADESFAGKVTKDGSSILGKWMQGKNGLALTLVRANVEAAWAIPAAYKMMPADADPKLEVATIKPTTPGMAHDGIHNRGRHLIIDNETVEFMVTFAYDLQAQQVQGGPGWLRSNKYDVDGTPDIEGHPSLKQMKTMVRKLLAERFALACHWGKKELGVYRMTVAKTGSKMNKSLEDGLPNQNGGGNPNGRTDRYSNVTMKDFASILQHMLDRPVVDQTGLQGQYDFVLKWTPNDADAADPALASPGIFTAMQEQLGLKLEAVKAQADVVVIDKVERPSAN